MPASLSVRPDRETSIDDERTLLIGDSIHDRLDGEALPLAVGADLKDGTEKPFPRVQVWLLCYTRMVGAVAFFFIFPFINQMVQNEGNISEQDVGFYSGLIESLFSLTQMCVTIFWVRAGDRYGRKPVLVTSLIGISVATGLFGFSSTIWQMVLFRCLAGAFGGNVIMIRTMLAEISTLKTQALIFSYFGFSGHIGNFLGPLIGGATLVPTQHQDSGTAIGAGLLTSYPFALPALVAAAIGLTSAVTTALFVEETLPTEVRTKTSISSSDNRHRRISTWELLRYDGVAMVLFLYGFGNVLMFAFTAVQPVYYFTSVALGGCGLTTIQISLLLGINGGAGAVWLLVVFPLLHKRIGTTGMLRFSAYIFPPFFACFPLLNLLLRYGTPTNIHNIHVAFWVLAPTISCLGIGITMVFTALQLALNEASPFPESLSLINAMALAIANGVRSFSPALFASLFAVGVKQNILWGQLFWVIAIILSFTFCIAVRYQPGSSTETVHEHGDDTEHEPH